MESKQKIIRWWVTAKLPDVHQPANKEAGVGFNKKVKMWVIHPIKRRLARYYLLILKKITGLTVIGITGSSGKTSTKEMLTSILKLVGKTNSSFKNIDPIYNIPDTILKTKPFTKYLILEMGVEYPGEMDFYIWLAKPEIGIITNIYPTHTEYFGNINGVFKEKSKLINALGITGKAILNNENKLLNKNNKGIKTNIYRFGKGTRVFAENIYFDKYLNTHFCLNIYGKKVDIKLSTLGKQFIENALASSLASHVLGIPNETIKKGLEDFRPSDHRMKVIKLKGGAILIDDSYNNNPEAAKRSLSTFSDITKGKNKIIVFGDMLELGKNKTEYHREIGRQIGNIGADVLICVGPLSKYVSEEVRKADSKRTKIFWVKKSNNVSDIIKRYLNKNSYIFIKGSRGIALDKVVGELS